MTSNAAEAEDLTQDTFLHVFRKINKFRGDSAFSTWLHRIAVNTVLMHFRKNSLNQVSLDEPQSNMDGDKRRREYGTRDKELAGCIDRLALARAMKELPPGYRTVFLLHEVEGYEHQEIAEMLSCSVGNSKSQLYKAKLRFRELLALSSRSQLGIRSRQLSTQEPAKRKLKNCVLPIVTDVLTQLTPSVMEVGPEAAWSRAAQTHDELPLDPHVATVLLEWKRLCPVTEGDWVFTSPRTNQPYDSGSLRKKVLKKPLRKQKFGGTSDGTRCVTAIELGSTKGSVPLGVQQKTYASRQYLHNDECLRWSLHGSEAQSQHIRRATGATPRPQEIAKGRHLDGLSLEVIGPLQTTIKNLNSP
jgi:RNA polymerase sigma factor (sigma-70 family)